MWGNNRLFHVSWNGAWTAERSENGADRFEHPAAAFGKTRFFFFKRGALSVSLYTPSQEHSLVGVSAVKGDSWISRIPVIGWFFGGGTKKIKVDVNAAKDVVASLSLLVLKAEESAV